MGSKPNAHGSDHLHAVRKVLLVPIEELLLPKRLQATAFQAQVGVRNGLEFHPDRAPDDMNPPPLMVFILQGATIACLAQWRMADV
jgi:hypothetical protein